MYIQYNILIIEVYITASIIHKRDKNQTSVSTYYVYITLYIMSAYILGIRYASLKYNYHSAGVKRRLIIHV